MADRQPRPDRAAVLRAYGLRQLYRLGWRVAARVPPGLVDRLIARFSRRAVERGGWHVENLRHNLSAVTGRPCDDALLRAAVASHLRNVYEQLALPGWSVAEILARVQTTGEDALRRAHAAPGAVVALPHSGNWDLAGAWACRSGLPVTTVAERLGDAEFAAFTAFRRRLGMEVLSHRDPDLILTLVGAVARGRVVCLLADRDLERDGVPVVWAGRPASMPVGPALVAQRSGAALFPAVSQFRGRGMMLRIGPPIQTRPGPAGLAAMTQDLADVFVARIAERPQDWHLLQPFFADDPRRLAREDR